MSKRVLSAILFADIAGYTGLMQENENEAVKLIGRFKDIVEKSTSSHDGRIIQYYGDGCLVSFNSATQATECAIAMQAAFIKEPAVPVRIGIHLGEVLFRSNTAFGNGVNVASRIESMGLPGSLLVSKTIRDLLLNKEGFELRSLGEFLFKHVKEPIEVFAVVKDGFVIPSREEMLSRMKSGKRVRTIPGWVLPVAAIILIITAATFILRGGNKKKDFIPEDKMEKPLTVVSFENLTKDKTLDVYGLMIKDWVSHGLQEAGRNVVISKKGEFDDLSTEKGKEASVPAGVEVIVKGRYYIPGEDQVAAVAEIVDAVTEKVLVTTKPVIAAKDSIISLLIGLEEQITAEWEGEEYTNDRQPPVFETYKTYLKGIAAEKSDPVDAMNHYTRALQQDSNFRKSFFALANLAIKTSKKTMADSLIMEGNKKQSQFTEYEKSAWEAIKVKASEENQ